MRGNQRNRHTNQLGTCQAKRIQTLAELCDNEYYMSAGGPTLGDLERAKRGLRRIKGYLRELEALKLEVECPSCRQEIERVIALQKQAIQEIETAWGRIVTS